MYIQPDTHDASVS